MFILETERLQLRKYTLEDAPFSFELMNSEAWIRNIGDRKITSLEIARDYIKKSYLPSYSDNGFGAYVVVLKDTGKPIGACGLYKRPHLNHPDVGFAFLPEFLGKGYGYESANAVMYYAKNTLNIITILGVTIKENTASRKLLEKIGLRQIDTIVMEGDDEELLLYSN
jgi:RimJ/RimL family protein N-acetyltransferase